MHRGIESYIASKGRVFRSFDLQDSGNRSVGVVDEDGRRLFLKCASGAQRVARLQNAATISRRCSHGSLPRLIDEVSLADGYALAYEWVDGEVLNTPEFAGSSGRNDPRSPHYRFRALPVGRRVRCINTILELHLELESLGYVAEDFYDGCIIYDFDRHATRICDLDEYHIGQFILDRPRTFGSTRFMEPEEFGSGNLIDVRTTVFNLGRAAFVLLADGGEDRSAWEASDSLWEIASKAVAPERSHRFQSVSELYAAWRVTGGSPGVAPTRDDV